MGSLKSNYKEKRKNSWGIISLKALFVFDSKRFALDPVLKLYKRMQYKIKVDLGC